MLNVSGSTAASTFSPNRTMYLSQPSHLLISPNKNGPKPQQQQQQQRQQHRQRDAVRAVANNGKSSSSGSDLNSSRDVTISDAAKQETKDSWGGAGLKPMSLEEMLLEGAGDSGGDEGSGGALTARPNGDNNTDEHPLSDTERTLMVRPSSALGWTVTSQDADDKLDRMLQSVLARVELGEEERMVAMERIRSDVASHNDHLEELTDLLSRHTDRIAELEKENKKVATALGGNTNLLAATAVASQQNRAVVLKELPRNDQEVLMSNLSMEMALLLSKGLTKMGDLVTKQQTDRSASTTSASPGVGAAGRLGGGGGALSSFKAAATAVTAANRLGGGSSNNNKLGGSAPPTATPAAKPFEAEVKDRLSQLGW